MEAIIIMLIIGGIIYFIPTIVAYSREHHNFTAILLLNIFAGWTLLGWVGALIWAVAKPPKVEGS